MIGAGDHGRRASAVLDPDRLRLIVEDVCPAARGAERSQVAWPTANRWAQRYPAAGEAGMPDRSSRPPPQPTGNPGNGHTQDRVPTLKTAPRTGRDPRPGRGGTLHRPPGAAPMPDQPTHHLDRTNGDPIRRYEHPACGRRPWSVDRFRATAVSKESDHPGASGRPNRAAPSGWAYAATASSPGSCRRLPPARSQIVVLELGTAIPKPPAGEASTARSSASVSGSECNAAGRTASTRPSTIKHTPRPTSSRGSTCCIPTDQSRPSPGHHTTAFRRLVGSRARNDRAVIAGPDLKRSTISLYPR